MHSVIVYPSNGGLAIAYTPAAEEEIDKIAAAIVPGGVPYRVVDASAIPPESIYRDALTANFDDEPCVVSVDPALKAAVDKRLAADAIEAWFANAISEGFATEDGWTLGLTDADVALLTGNFVLAQAADSMGMPLPQIIDRNGVAHTMPTLSEFTSVMLAYGTYRASLSEEYASRKSALEE